MHKALLDMVWNRLESDETLAMEAKELVLAACQGEEHLTCQLEERELSIKEESEEESGVEPFGAYLKSLTVEGFRGVGAPVKLELPGGPGLTLVLGRNGSGKSSFAEALELLLTGESRRWKERAQIWREGWRNLHHSGRVSLQAELVVEGKRGLTVASRAWDETTGLEEGKAYLQHQGAPRTALEELGWSKALHNYRPFLSYHELGSMLEEGPSKLHDSLSSILGLDELVNAQERLRQARLSRQREEKDVTKQLVPIWDKLQQIEDERAKPCRRGLSERPWDLEAVEAAVLGGSEEEDTEGQIHLLRRLSTLEPPPSQEVTELTESLRNAARQLQEIAGSEAEQDRAIAHLLQKAIDFHKKHGDQNCPVCEKGFLDDHWREESEQRMQLLGERAKRAETAHRNVVEVRQRVESLLQPPPNFLERAAEVGLGSADAQKAYGVWSKPGRTDDLVHLADHMESSLRPLEKALHALRERARVELDRRQSLWRPIAVELGSWLPKAKSAQRNSEKIPLLEAAEGWMKSTAADLRNQRFEPIADKAAEIWKLLRQQSNVDLGRIELEGSGSRRRVVLDVTVDGVPAVALGVMSQGELHCLALSLFVPRATLAESPFRFMVIDDPVQSMDPARVEGLARVLQTCAKERQVILFTHDTRLFEAVRRLQIEATVLEVTRRANSVIEIRKALDP